MSLSSIRYETDASVSQLEKNQSRIRNFCIVAHVDHGKTTLSDSLLSYAGIISGRLVGKVKFLDYYDEEQERNITMKSSNITFTYDGGRQGDEKYLINLIDSPGHIDFVAEVNAAVRLCDGALVVVDILEGVAVQTRTSLENCWNERVKPVLAINKIDRLFIDLKLSVEEAYESLHNVVVQMNAHLATLYNTEKSLRSYEQGDLGPEFEAGIQSFLGVGDVESYFSPADGNVIFCSAIDGWGFTLPQFAAMYEAKYGMGKNTLKDYMWGDFSYNRKKQKVQSSETGSGRMPRKRIFESLVLDPIWGLYKAAIEDNDVEKIEKIIKSLKLSRIQPREIRSKDRRLCLRAVIRKWLPLADIVLDVVTRMVPSPQEAQQLKYHTKSTLLTEASGIPKRVASAVNSCSNVDELVIVEVAKIFAVNRSQILRKRISSVEESGLDNSDEILEFPAKNGFKEEEEDALKHRNMLFIGFARVLSGSIAAGSELYVVRKAEEEQKVKLKGVYRLLGGSLEPMARASAGTIVGILGIEEAVLHSAILSSERFTGDLHVHRQLPSDLVIMVALQPRIIVGIEPLLAGISLLLKADPSANYEHSDKSGEIYLHCTGEVHLEHCVRNLRQRFCPGVEFDVSEPLVPFRETIVESTAEVRHSSTICCRIESLGIVVKMSVTALPLPTEVTNLIEKNRNLLQLAGKKDGDKNHDISGIRIFWSQLRHVCADQDFHDISDRIWRFGPEEVDTNILASDLSSKGGFLPSFSFPSEFTAENDDIRESAGFEGIEDENRSRHVCNFPGGADQARSIANSISASFKHASERGPLSGESLWGVCVLIDDLRVQTEEESDEFGGEEVALVSNLGHFITHCVRAIHGSLPRRMQRLVEPVYELKVATKAEVLGKVHAVLARRRGTILEESMRTETDSSSFVVRAYLPVAESFGLCDELWKRASGAAWPQLVFSHWAVLPVDPYYAPTTEEEIEEFGSLDASRNIAKEYVNKIRERKGIATEEKLVEFGDKQRTLSKKK